MLFTSCSREQLSQCVVLCRYCCQERQWWYLSGSLKVSHSGNGGKIDNATFRTLCEVTTPYAGPQVLRTTGIDGRWIRCRSSPGTIVSCGCLSGRAARDLRWSSGISAPIICVWLRTVDGTARAPRKSWSRSSRTSERLGETSR